MGHKMRNILGAASEKRHSKQHWAPHSAELKSELQKCSSQSPINSIPEGFMIYTHTLVERSKIAMGNIDVEHDI